MKSGLVNLFVLSAIILNSALAEQLVCNFASHSNGYNCEMKNVFEETKEISSVTGDHKYGKSTNDVEVFYITDISKTKYVPSKVCSFFPKMYKYDIYGGMLAELKKDIFEGCASVTKVVIKYLKLKTIEEDLLSELQNLESFTLSFTLVEVLPTRLFEKNKNLKNVDLSFNKLNVISTSFPSTLAFLSVMENDCIDSHYDSRYIPSTTSLPDLIKDVYRKCNAGNDAPVIHTNSQVQTRMLEEQINSNENKLNKIESDLQTLEDKLSKKIEDVIKTFKIFEMETNEKTMNFNNTMTALERNTKEQIDSFFIITSDLSEDSRNFKMKFERNHQLEERSKNLESLINRNKNLLIMLFCIQLIMIASMVVFGVYKKFYSRLY